VNLVKTLVKPTGPLVPNGSRVFPGGEILERNSAAELGRHNGGQLHLRL
jgi:hypothetical protein